MNAVEIEEAISALAELPFDGGAFPFAFLEAFGKANYALFDRKGRALAVLEANSTSVNLGAGGTRKVCCANA